MIEPQWPAPANVRAVTTTRAGGVSAPPYDSFNLAAHVGDAPAAVRDNRERLRRQLVLPADPFWLEQVHGTGVVEARGGSPDPCPQADASFTRLTGTVCAVMTADCLPVLLCDRDASLVAAAHAGGRGLAGGVLDATVAARASAPEPWTSTCYFMTIWSQNRANWSCPATRSPRTPLSSGRWRKSPPTPSTPPYSSAFPSCGGPLTSPPRPYTR